MLGGENFLCIYFSVLIFSWNLLFDHNRPEDFHTVFSPEDGESLLFRNAYIDLSVHTMTQSRGRTSYARDIKYYADGMSGCSVVTTVHHICGSFVLVWLMLTTQLLIENMR